MTPILGPAQCSAEDARQWVLAKAAPDWWADLTSVYWAEAPTTGVRPEVGYAQACKETGFGYARTSPSSVLDPSFHNPAGIKVASGGGDYDPDAHYRFPTWRDGIRDHLYRLWRYATPATVPTPKGWTSVRPVPSSYWGQAPTVEQLSGKWAPSSTYHESIVRFVDEMTPNTSAPAGGSHQGDTMTAYLVTHPPHRSQFREVRRAKPTGTIVIHSAENLPDVRPPDTGAEDVAGFIQRRDTPGSYHRLCDSDTTVKLVPFAWEAFHDGTGSNPWSIGISGAFRAHQWRELPKWWRDACVLQMAAAAREAADWLHACYGIEVPAIRLTKATANHPGFCSHAEREEWFGTPGRRSDPGPWFPWDEFLFLFAFSGHPAPQEDSDLHGTDIIASYGEAGYDLSGVTDQSRKAWAAIRVWTHEIYAKPAAERDGGVAYIRALLGLR